MKLPPPHTNLRHQCDQMLELNVARYCQKLPKNTSEKFYFKKCKFSIGQVLKVAKILNSL